MLDIKNINYEPTIHEIGEYINNPLFFQFYDAIMKEYKALCHVQYSKDVWFPGWNIKLKKAGKALCAIYPKETYFTVLVVIGRKEKEKAESLLPSFCEKIQTLYKNTKEGSGQRWLMIDLYTDNCVYEDTLRLVRIRRECK